MNVYTRVLQHFLQHFTYFQLTQLIYEQGGNQSLSETIIKVYEYAVYTNKVEKMVIDSPEICINLELTYGSLDYAKINYRQFSFYQMLQFIQQYEASQLHDTILENMLSVVVKNSACEAYLVHAILAKPYSSTGIKIITNSHYLIKEDKTWVAVLKSFTKNLYFEYYELSRRASHFQRVLQMYVLDQDFLKNKRSHIVLVMRLLLNNISCMKVEPLLIKSIENVFLEMHTCCYEWLFLSLLCRISYSLSADFSQLFIDVFKNIAFCNLLKSPACQKSIVTIFNNIFKQFGQSFYDNHLYYHLILFLVYTLNEVKPLVFYLIYYLYCLTDQDYEIFISSLNPSVTKDDTNILTMSARFIQVHITKSAYLFQAIIDYIRTHTELSSIFIIKALIYSIVSSPEAYTVEQQQCMFYEFVEYIPAVIYSSLCVQNKFQLLLATVLAIFVTKHQFQIRSNDFSMIKLAVSFILSEEHVLERTNHDFKAMLMYCLFCSFYYLISSDATSLRCMYDFSYDMVNFGLGNIHLEGERRISKNFDNIQTIFYLFSDLVAGNRRYGDELISLINKCLVTNFTPREHSYIYLELMYYNFFGLLDQVDYYAFNVGYLSVYFVRYLYYSQKYEILYRLLVESRLLGRSAWHYFDGSLMEIKDNYSISSDVFSLCINLFEKQYKQMVIAFNQYYEAHRIEIRYVADSALYITYISNGMAVSETTYYVGFSEQEDELSRTRVLAFEFERQPTGCAVYCFVNRKEICRERIDSVAASIYTTVSYLGNYYVTAFSFDQASYLINTQRRVLSKIVCPRENQFAYFISIFEQAKRANIFYQIVYDLHSGALLSRAFSLVLLVFILHFDYYQFACVFRQNLLHNQSFLEFTIDYLNDLRREQFSLYYSQVFYFVYNSVCSALANVYLDDVYYGKLIALSLYNHAVNRSTQYFFAICCRVLENKDLCVDISHFVRLLPAEQLIKALLYPQTCNQRAFSQVLEAAYHHNFEDSYPQLLHQMLTVGSDEIRDLLLSYSLYRGLIAECNRLLPSNMVLCRALYCNLSQGVYGIMNRIPDSANYFLLFGLLSLYYNADVYEQEFRQREICAGVSRIITIDVQYFGRFAEQLFAPLKYCVDVMRSRLSQQLFDSILDFMARIAGCDPRMHRIAQYGLPRNIYWQFLQRYAGIPRSDAFNYSVTCIFHLTEYPPNDTLLLDFVSRTDAIYYLIHYYEKTHLRDDIYIQRLTTQILDLTTDEAFFLRSIVNDSGRAGFSVRYDFTAQVAYVLDYATVSQDKRYELNNIIGDSHLSFVYKFLFDEAYKRLTATSQMLLQDQREIQEFMLALQEQAPPRAPNYNLKCCFNSNPEYAQNAFPAACATCGGQFTQMRTFNKFLLRLCAPDAECVMYSEQLAYPGKRMLLRKMLVQSNKFYFHPFVPQNTDMFLANCLFLNYFRQHIISIRINAANQLILAAPTFVPKYLAQLEQLIHFQNDKNRIALNENCSDEYGRRIKYGLYDYLGDEPNYYFQCVSLASVRLFFVKQFANYFDSVELVLNDSRSLILIFENNADYNTFMSNAQIKQVYEVCSSQQTLKSLIKSWKNYEISMYAFILAINYLAGRSYIDLYYYPIFPFVHSERRYDVVIGGYNSALLTRLREKRSEFMSSNEGEAMSVFYTFYSHRAVASHYLFQIEPFTTVQRFLYHGLYDCYDRQFVSLERQWEKVLAGKSFSELVPEFFSSWQFMANLNGLNYNENVLPDVSVSQEKYPEILRATRSYRLQLEQMQASIVDWLFLIFGGAISADMFPPFVSYYRYANFETPELNKSLFYGTQPLYILARATIPEKKPPTAEFELKDRFYADYIIRGDLPVYDVPVPYIACPRLKPFISNSKIAGTSVVEQSLYQITLNQITKTSETKGYMRIEETTQLSSYHFAQYVGAVQVLSHDAACPEVIASIGGRLCLLANGYVDDLGIEYCDALAVFPETRYLVCVFNGTVITYYLIGPCVREIARKELAYYEKVLQLVVDRINAKFAVLLKMSGCCQIQTYDFMLNYLGQAQLREDVKFCQFLYYYDVHRWTLFATQSSAFILSTENDEQVFELDGNYQSAVQPSRNMLHLQAVDKTVQVIYIYALGILY